MVTGIGEQQITSVDGTLLFVKQFHAENPKAQVLVSHGYLEHCLRYTEFAEHLNAKGISVTVYDLRGHGSSHGDRAYLDKWEDYHFDLDAVRSTLFPLDQLPTFLLGHSTGGLITLDYMLQNPKALAGLKGAITISPYVEPSESLNPLKIGAAKLFGTLAPNLPIPSGLDSSELTSDPVKQQEHREDTNIQKNARAGWASRTLGAQARVKKLVETTEIPLPVLFLYGDADPVASPVVNESVANKLKCEDKTVLLRKGEKHELLNEINREELYGVIANWIDERRSTTKHGR